MIGRRAHFAVAVALFGCGEVDVASAPSTEPFLADVPPQYVLVDQDAQSAFLVARNGRLANLVVSEAAYESFRSGTWKFRYQMQISRRVLSGRFPDVFDFLIMTFDPRDPRRGSAGSCCASASHIGSHTPTKRDVAGLNLGNGEHDDRWNYVYGGGNQLRSLIMVPDAAALREGPLFHLIAHSWGANLIYTSMFEHFSHWGLAGVGGQLGGWAPGTLEIIEPGVYRARALTGVPFHHLHGDGHRVPYAPLELYMMGFLSPDSVPPVEMAHGGVVVDTLQGTFTADSIGLVTMAEITRDGLNVRRPSHLEAQRDYRALLVVLSATPLPDDVLETLAHDIDQLTLHAADDRDDVLNFWEATGGRATLQFDGLQEFSPDP